MRNPPPVRQFPSNAPSPLRLLERPWPSLLPDAGTNPSTKYDATPNRALRERTALGDPDPSPSVTSDIERRRIRFPTRNAPASRGPTPPDQRRNQRFRSASSRRSPGRSSERQPVPRKSNRRRARFLL